MTAALSLSSSAVGAGVNRDPALDAAARTKLVGSLEKDLTKTPDHELWPHVREWVSPARRPGV